MTYLLDTVVVSEMRKRHGHPNVLQWLHDKTARSLYLSTVTIGEIERGVRGNAAPIRPLPRPWAHGSNS
ncbi:MAG: hypothetical protein ACREET_03110 [Stellaceae bacterium]